MHMSSIPKTYPFCHKIISLSRNYPKDVEATSWSLPNPWFLSSTVKKSRISITYNYLRGTTAVTCGVMLGKKRAPNPSADISNSTKAGMMATPWRRGSRGVVMETKHLTRDSVTGEPPSEVMKVKEGKRGRGQWISEMELKIELGVWLRT